MLPSRLSRCMASLRFLQTLLLFDHPIFAELRLSFVITRIAMRAISRGIIPITDCPIVRSAGFDDIHGSVLSRLRYHVNNWWTRGILQSRPSRCHRDALLLSYESNTVYRHAGRDLGHDSAFLYAARSILEPKCRVELQWAMPGLPT